MGKDIYSKEHRDLVKQLKKAREEAGLSQIDAAKKIDKTQSYVSKLESGQRKVNVAQLRRFAKAYRKDIKYFIR